MRGRARSEVSLFQHGEQLGQYAIYVFVDIRVVHADNLVAEFRQFLIALTIVCELYRRAVRASVDFDNHTLFAADKIDEIIFDCELTYELETSEATIAQVVPELIFGRRRIRSQDTRTIGFPWSRPTHIDVHAQSWSSLPLTLTLSPSRRGEG